MDQFKVSPLIKRFKCILCRIIGIGCTYRYCVTGMNFAFVVESSEKITAIEAATRAIEFVFSDLENSETIDGRNPSIGEFLSVHSLVFEKHFFVPTETVLANAGYYNLAKEMKSRLNNKDK